ncbi:MAG: DUF4900 domain-containing protein [Candidatus Eisenbacteria sp.]|nr:DUF4900 domain-containing protein [Candidatus Eisenbacteria bacterium]
MNSTRKTLGSESGSTLVVVMIFSLIMLISALALVELSAQDAALAIRDMRVSQAFYNAEAGAERGEAWLKGQESLPTTLTMPFSDSPESFADGLMLVAIAPDASGARIIYTIRSLSTVHGKSRAIEVDLTPTAFTDYLYYTNNDVGPGSPGYFRTGDVIDGPIHINDLLAVWGDPVFESEIHTSATEIYYHNNWNPIQSSALSNAPYDNPVFEEGIALGAATIPWLAESDLNTLKGMAGLSLSNVKIIFGRDPGTGPMLGYVSHSKVNQDNWTDVDLSSFNGIIYVNGACLVSGILDGQATLVNNATIDIVDDLTYAGSDANGPLPGCNDILGLVASTKVSIADNVANGSDCVVHAHIMSMNNQASLVENYSQGSPRGTLTIHGGLAQDKWGPVGTGYYDEVDEFHLLTGYERNFHYDWRLRNMLPPGYSAIIFNGGGFNRLVWREIAPVDLTCWEG